MGKNKKQNKKQSSGRLRGFIGVTISLVLLLGVGIGSAFLNGKEPFSFATTGSFLEKFDEDDALKTKARAEQFFVEGTRLYDRAAITTKYHSYTLDYKVSFLETISDHTYISVWKDVHACVDRDYTVFTVVEDAAVELDFVRSVKEYVLCKTGAHAGELWLREGNADEAAGDLGLLEKGAWVQVEEPVENLMEEAFSLLVQARYSYYDAFEGQFEFSVEKDGKGGEGTFKPGPVPELSFTYGADGRRPGVSGNGDHAHYSWDFSYINATKAVVPQSLLDKMGGNA